MTTGWLAALILTVGLTGAMAQSLPVKIHRKVMAFDGGPNVIITQNAEVRYSLLSAHKEAGRPWADALIQRQTATARTLISRAYDCARGTYRNLGEGRTFQSMTASVTPADVRDRALSPGTIEYTLARYVCAL